MYLYFSANILLSRDLTPKIGDFGLARQASQIRGNKTHLTTATIIGTTVYMPPEAFDSKISPAWDCYSFGVVSITGTHAFC